MDWLFIHFDPEIFIASTRQVPGVCSSSSCAQGAANRRGRRLAKRVQTLRRSLRSCVDCGNLQIYIVLSVCVYFQRFRTPENREIAFLVRKGGGCGGRSQFRGLLRICVSS